MKKIVALILLLCWSVNAQAGVPDSLVFKLKRTARANTETEGGGIISYAGEGFANDYYFLFKNELSPRFAEKNYNDSAWEVHESDHSLEVSEIASFKGYGTFRLHYRFTKGTEGHPLFCVLAQMGASTVYDDGKLVAEYGTPATSAAGERVLVPRFSPFCIVHNDTLEHVITVLYSNNTGYSTNVHYSDFRGFDLNFYLLKGILFSFEMKSLFRTICITLGSFFLALFIVHLFLFFADKGKRFNLFYALFMLMLALAFTRFTVSSYIESPSLLYKVNRVAEYFVPSCCLFLLTLLYSLFQKKFNFFYYFMVLLFIVFIITNFMEGDINNMLYACMFMTTYFGVTILSIKAIRRKYHGARYLGWGVLLFTILFTVGIISVIITHSGVSLIVFIALAVLSLPLSMTAYLSHDFAMTSKSLQQQLETNEELSRQTIRQEKEKQELLANQNKVLEVQVEQRTHEIAKQNKMLEHQKKEITDSINYAKRIQQALLPDLQEISTHLPNSFIFYLPKDIVSGDFYFFHQKDNAIYIAAADCTGHGVPGALMSMIVHEKLNHAMESYSSPAEILKSINSQVKDALKQNQGEHASRDGCDIAICRITDETVTYAGAYRPLYIFNRQNEFSELKATKTAIAGLTPYEQVFEETTLPVSGLKMIYMFSDGY
ncbi:MAG: SpoIIE family protein phosphatase, partial [Bacteroidia bacterium]